MKRWFWPVKVGAHVVNIKDEDCVMASLMLIWVTTLRTWGFSSLSRSGKDLRNRQDLILYVFLCSSSSVIIFRLSEHLFIQQSYLTFFSTFRSINSSLVGLGLALIQTCLHLLGVVRLYKVREEMKSSLHLYRLGAYEKMVTRKQSYSYWPRSCCS